MTARRSRVWALPLVLIGAVLLLGVLPNNASGGQKRFQFERFDPAADSPTGHNVIEDCNPADSTDPNAWSDARASFTLNERRGSTTMTFAVLRARPNTYFTVWLRLRGEDSEGNIVGGNPLTGIPGTPLVPSWDLPNQLAITPPHPGSSQDLVHGFFTNRNGNGNLNLVVDFPITSGAYPFQRFPDFDTHKDDPALTNDANMLRLGGQAPTIQAVAIQDGSTSPFTIRLASHCVDGVVHGLVPGPHENWFDWSVE